MLKWARAMNAVVRQIIPRESPDIWPKIGTGGVSYTLRRKPARGETVTKKHPFQASVVGTEFDDGEWKNVSVTIARGSVLKGDSFDGGTEILALADTFELEADHFVWIQVTFTTAGVISGISLMSGESWPNFPSLYDDFGEGGNNWSHPLARVRDVLDGESPDFGEDKKLIQLTSTHLVTQRQCVDGVLIWKLVPGPGGSLA